MILCNKGCCYVTQGVLLFSTEGGAVHEGCSYVTQGVVLCYTGSDSEQQGVQRCDSLQQGVLLCYTGGGAMLHRGWCCVLLCNKGFSAVILCITQSAAAGANNGKGMTSYSRIQFILAPYTIIFTSHSLSKLNF